MKVKRILVTGSGGAPSTNFIRSLRSSGKEYFIVGTDSDPYNLKKSEADVSYLCSPCTNKSYFQFLNYVIKKHLLEFVHIQNDNEIDVISRNREKIEANLFLPDKQTVEICLDKFKTFDIWSKNGIKVPKTFFISNTKDLKKSFEVLSGKVWLREIRGAGGKGSLQPKDFKQAEAWINFKGGWGKFTASELLTPHSITWMSIWKEGKLIVAQSRKRLYWALSKISPSGVTGVTGAGVTVSDAKVDEISKRSILAIDKKPNGIFSVDLTYDFAGVPNPTEINIGRFFTTNEFFTRAGLNMPDIFVCTAFGEKINKLKRKVNPLRPGLIWIREVDFLPILTSEKSLEKDRILMERILSKFK